MSKLLLTHRVKVEQLINQLLSFCTALNDQVEDYFDSLPDHETFGSPLADPIAWHFIIDWCAKVEEIIQWQQIYSGKLQNSADTTQKGHMQQYLIRYQKDMTDNLRLYEKIIGSDFYRGKQSVAHSSMENSSDRISEAKEQIDRLNAQLLEKAQKERMDLATANQMDLDLSVLADEVAALRSKEAAYIVVKQQDDQIIHDLTQRINDLLRDKHNDAVELDKLGTVITQNDDTIKDLEDEIERLKNDMLNLQLQIQQDSDTVLAQDNTILANELSALRIENDNMKKDIAERDLQKKELDAQQAQLTGLIDNLYNSEHLLKTAIDNLETKIVDLQANIKDLNDDKTKLQAEVDDMKADKVNSDALNLVQIAQLQKAKDDLDEAETKIAGNFTEIQNLSDKIHTLQQEESHMLIEIQTLADTISALEKSLNILRKTVTTLPEGAPPVQVSGLSKIKVAEHIKFIFESFDSTYQKLLVKYTTKLISNEAAQDIFRKIKEFLEASLDLFATENSLGLNIKPALSQLSQSLHNLIKYKELLTKKVNDEKYAFQAPPVPGQGSGSPVAADNVKGSKKKQGP